VSLREPGNDAAAKHRDEGTMMKVVQ